MAHSLTHSQQAAHRLMAKIVSASALAGGLYGLAISVLLHGEFQPMAIAQGLFCGAVISLWCALFDLWLPDTRLGPWLRGLTFARFVALKTLYYVVGIDGGIFLGEQIFSPLYGGAPWSPTDPAFIATFLLALVISAGVNFTLEMSRLLGPNVLRNFLTGRYHQPREERRIFLFVDMIDSTKLAEQLGNVEFHRLLNDFFSDLTEPILATSGEIHAYVGDQVIVTWPLADESANARSLICYRDMQLALQRQRNRYLGRYGIIPDFRAALHAGTVVSGEMGVQKRQIVFLGDTVNTTARLEQVARELDLPAIISGGLLRQTSMPAGLESFPLGQRRLRGKDLEVELHGLRSHNDVNDSEAA